MKNKVLNLIKINKNLKNKLIYILIGIFLILPFQNCMKNTPFSAIDLTKTNSDDLSSRSTKASLSSVKSQCFINVDRSCTPPDANEIKNQLLNGKSVWATRTASRRDELYSSDDVQKSFEGCKSFAHLLKTECLLNYSPTTVYYADTKKPDDKVIYLPMGFDTEMDKNPNLTPAFVEYFKECKAKTKKSCGNPGPNEVYLQTCSDNGTWGQCLKGCDIGTHEEGVGICVKDGFHMRNESVVSNYQSIDFPFGYADTIQTNASAIGYYSIWDPIKKTYRGKFPKCKPGFAAVNVAPLGIFCLYRLNLIEHTVVTTPNEVHTFKYSCMAGPFFGTDYCKNGTRIFTYNLNCGVNCPPMGRFAIGQPLSYGTIYSLIIDPKDSIAGYSVMASKKNSMLTDSFKEINLPNFYAVINGECGTANNTNTNVMPSSNLCNTTAQIATTVSLSSGIWKWTCTGSNKGATANCSATKSTNATTTPAAPVAQAAPAAPTVVVNNIQVPPNTNTAPAVIAGVCGTANKTIISTIPSTASALCKTTLKTANVTGSGTTAQPWSWTCAGTKPINDAKCSATKSVPVPVTVAAPGVCGTANNNTYSNKPPATNLLCAKTATTPTSLSAKGPWKWSCTGVNGGVTVKCSASIIPTSNGICGGSNNVKMSNAPTFDLCNATTTVPILKGSGPWTWNCTGINASKNVTCKTK